MVLIADCEEAWAISLARERVSTQSWAERVAVLSTLLSFGLSGLVGSGGGTEGFLFIFELFLWLECEVLAGLGSSKMWRLSG